MRWQPWECRASGEDTSLLFRLRRFSINIQFLSRHHRIQWVTGLIIFSGQDERRAPPTEGRRLIRRCYTPRERLSIRLEAHMATAPAQNTERPGPPKFATVEEERRHRKERLAASFRLFSKFGFDEGVTGHITARDPERTDHFWVNPFGMHFGQIRVSDLLLVNH